MSNHPSASLQYGFLIEPDEELCEQINKLFETKQVDTSKVEVDYYGTDGYCGLCIYAVGSGVSASYADSGFELAPLVSMEKEFKETMEDFCREHNLEDIKFGWCLCANYG